MEKSLFSISRRSCVSERVSAARAPFRLIGEIMNKLPLLACLAVLMLPWSAAWADDTPAAADTATQAAPAAATAASAPAPTAPFLMSVDKISAGDTAWMLTSTALVLMMSIPGLALF